MSLNKEEFIALHNKDGYFCLYCVDEEKKVKQCEEIFEGGVQYFMNEEKYPREYAEK